MTRLIFVIISLFALLFPAQPTPNTGVRKRTVVLSVFPPTAASSSSSRRQAAAPTARPRSCRCLIGGSGKPVLEISSGAQWDCDRIR